MTIGEDRSRVGPVTCDAMEADVESLVNGKRATPGSHEITSSVTRFCVTAEELVLQALTVLTVDAKVVDVLIVPATVLAVFTVDELALDALTADAKELSVSTVDTTTSVVLMVDKLVAAPVPSWQHVSIGDFRCFG